MRLLVVLVLVTAAYAEEVADPSLTREVESYLRATQPKADEKALKVSWHHSPEFENADGSFRIRLHGRILIDWTLQDNNFQTDPPSNSVSIRQARMGITGNIWRTTIFAMQLEFANGIVEFGDAFIGLSGIGRFGALKFGHLREPFSMQHMTSLATISFQERAASTNAFSPGRNVGVRLTSATHNTRLTWSAGFFRVTDDQARSEGGDGYAFTVRVTGLVHRWDDGRFVHAGLSASFRRPSDDTTQFSAQPESAASPALVDTGPIPATRDLRAGIELAFLWNSFHANAEAYVADVSGAGVEATFTGWFAVVSYWLTGEKPNFLETRAIYGRVGLKERFQDGSGGKGAWELALRFDRVDLTDGGVTGGIQNSTTLGANWHWNPNTRVVFNLVYSRVTGGVLGDGNVFIFQARFQFDF